MGKLKQSAEKQAGGEALRKVARLENELAEARKANEEIGRQLEECRAAKRPRKIPRAKPGRCRAGDIVRVMFGDLHGCRMSLPAVSALLHDVKMLEPDEIILGGDMMEAGGFLARTKKDCGSALRGGRDKGERNIQVIGNCDWV